MARGGKRPGAGRKPTFTFGKKLALANEISLLRQKNPKLSNAKALDQLEAKGLIRPHTRKRYLTPKFFDEEIRRILEEHERIGILALLPRLSHDDPL